MRLLHVFALYLGIMLSFVNVASALTSTDVQDYSTQTLTTYFVDHDYNTYNYPYYRGYGENWGWQHNAIAGSFTTATLYISAFDVDWIYGEVDNIYAYDNGNMVLLGSLTGQDGAWSYGSFTLGSNFFDDINNGLQVFLEIDTTIEGWWVTLAKSVLSIDNGAIPNPEPGAVPEPGTMVLLGAGLVGMMAWRRKQQA